MLCLWKVPWGSICLNTLNIMVRKAFVCASFSGTLRLNADSLYAHLGVRPHVAEETVDFLARICRDEIGRHTALNYYMSALLLDKKLDKFVSAVDMYCFEQDTLPRYYREALVLFINGLILDMEEKLKTR